MEWIAKSFPKKPHQQLNSSLNYRIALFFGWTKKKNRKKIRCLSCPF